MDIYEKAEKSQKKAQEGLEDKENNTIQSSLLETENFIVEQILGMNNEHSERSVSNIQTDYVKYYKTNPEKIERVDRVGHNGKVFIPIQGKMVTEKIVTLPTGVEEYNNDKDLISDISNFLFSYFQVSPFDEAILPYIVLFYWISDKFPFVPYLQFLGLPGTGKSTALEVVGAVCYKAIRASGGTSFASIFRLAHQWKGTLLLNEFELGERGSEAYRALVQLLRSGVEHDPLFKVEGEGRKQVEVFDIKAPRIFASQTEIGDAALSSRTIPIHMSKATKRLPLYKLDNFNKKAEKLRNQLLLWRLRHLDQINLSKIEYGFPELEKFDIRIQQVITPIYYLASEEIKKSIRTLMEEQEKETKRERLEELDGIIYTKILDEYNRGMSLIVGNITNSINIDREEQGYKTKLTPKKIGAVIRKIMGIKSERKGDGYHIILTPRKIEELNSYYDLPVSNTDTLSTQSSSGEARDIKDKEKTVNISIKDISEEGSVDEALEIFDGKV